MLNSRIKFLIPVVLACVLLAAGDRLVQWAAAQAQPATDVSGTISVDTTWSLASGPYVVVGDVTVNPGIRLTIEPGVQVRFDGVYALIVRGTLVAEGHRLFL